MELVHIVPGGLALAPIHRDAVPYLILNDQHPKIFELLAKLLDIKADKAVVDIHISSVIKNIQTAMHIQFQCRRDPLRLRLRLPLDLVIEVAKDRHVLRLRIGKIGAVHHAHRTVDDRFLHRLQTVAPASCQFAEG